MWTLHTANPLVYYLPLCFSSHLPDHTLSYFKIQQAVRSWHFAHMAITAKYLPNVSSLLHLSVTPGNVHALLLLHFPSSTIELSRYHSLHLLLHLPPGIPSAIPMNYVFNSLNLFLPKTWGNYSLVSTQQCKICHSQHLLSPVFPS